MIVTDIEALEVSLRAAVDRGFHWLDFFSSAENPYTHSKPVIYIRGSFDEVIERLYHDNTWPVLIFNRRFTQSLWGNRIIQVPHECADIECPNISFDKVPAWKWHTQQMATSINPLRYLGKHYDGKV
jgi:hypothetical protein